MRYRHFTAFLIGCIAAAGAGLTGCGDDSSLRPVPLPAEQYKDLTQKDDVLFNLQRSYSERKVTEYDRLLDEGFQFCFSDFDVMYRDAPACWDRVTEVLFTDHFLGLSGFEPGDHRVISIELKLTYADTNWTPQPAPPSHEGETWYRQTVGYDLTVKTADDWEYRASQHIEITIRWEEALGHWQIVRMRDGAAPGAAPGAPGRRSAGGIAPTYWGTLKIGYQL